jgi:hypothetical protein
MASNNEKVSDLLELYATDIQSNDILLSTDMSVRESKKLEIGQLLLFIESSGSFFAYDSTHAGTASYILASGISGIVSAASNASQSISSSWANTAVSSSYSATSSLAILALASLNNNAITASFLQYSAIPNGTASYSITSLNANAATTAYSLYYNGQPNGTASWAVSASNVVSTSYSVASSNSNTASFAFSSITSAFASNSTSASISLQSNQSQTASYLVNNGPKFIVPVVVFSSVNFVPFTTFDCSPYVPTGTQTVILDGWSTNANTNTAGFIYIRSSGVGQTYILTSYKSGGGGDANSMGGQGCFPTSASTFQYSFSQAADGGTTLRLIGYY